MRFEPISLPTTPYLLYATLEKEKKKLYLHSVGGPQYSLHFGSNYSFVHLLSLELVHQNYRYQTSLKIVHALHSLETYIHCIFINFQQYLQDFEVVSFVQSKHQAYLTRVLTRSQKFYLQFLHFDQVQTILPDQNLEFFNSFQNLIGYFSL